MRLLLMDGAADGDTPDHDDVQTGEAVAAARNMAAELPLERGAFPLPFVLLTVSAALYWRLASPCSPSHSRCWHFLIGRLLRQRLNSTHILVSGLAVVGLGNALTGWGARVNSWPLVMLGMLALGSGGGLLNGETQKPL